jgi:hypothetical protein
MRLAQDRMALSANIHRRDITYNIGDMVYISTKTITAGTEIAKFKVRWIGPYKILERRNPVAYKVDIPYEMVVNKVYPVYHVSKLKPALTSTLQPPPEPTALPAEVLAILKREIRGGVVKYRVYWGPPYGPADDSWENADEIEKCAALDTFLEKEQRRESSRRRSDRLTVQRS